MSDSESRREKTTYERIYAVVRRVPHGKVATYGQVAEMAGLKGHARQVGYALHALPRGTRVPWHRIMNARGQISLRRQGGADLTQRMLLEKEGVAFDMAGRVSLDRFRWTTTRKRNVTKTATRSGTSR
jgi:methylated-DNA-protein-cysteine methyltransferase-like protein